MDNFRWAQLWYDQIEPEWSDDDYDEPLDEVECDPDPDYDAYMDEVDE